MVIHWKYQMTKLPLFQLYTANYSTNHQTLDNFNHFSASFDYCIVHTEFSLIQYLMYPIF